MKVISTPLKKPLVRYPNGDVKKFEGKPVRDLSKPFIVKKIKGKFEIISPRNGVKIDPSVFPKPFFTFHSQSQADDFVKRNNEKRVKSPRIQKQEPVKKK